MSTAAMFVACALLSACGGSHTASTPSPTTGELTVTQAVTDTYQRFFDGSTSADDKIALLENGQAFAEAIRAQANSPMAKATTATVSNVASTATDHADVTFTILFNGQPALANQQGSAVHADGGWKVTAVTFCALLTLEGNPPPACAAATPTPGR
ncbi:hypothetical protein [Nocardia sp. NPDC051570]|uniref:hypothetical protein n=1 Tax=Nocardia sp. NPDC051570 TaxID=3364324 RepID=UPI00378B13AF